MISLFSITDSLGGAEQLLFKLAKFYKKSGEEVSVCFFGNKTNSTWEEEGFTVFYSNNSLKAFLGFLQAKQFNSVFSSHLMMNALLGFFRSIGVLKTKYLICRESTTVFGRYSGLKLLKYKFAYWVGYRRMDLLITQSDLMKSKLLTSVSFLNKRTLVKTIPNLFEFPEREITPIVLDQPYLVSAGRLIPEKGFDLLIVVFQALKKQFPKYKLVILGEGEERGKLEQLIRENALEDDVILKGFVEDVYPYFKGAELCVVSSRLEGFPNVLLQMMSQNSNVISTLCAGGIEALEGVITCRANDKDALLEALVLGITTPDKKINRLSFDIELNSRSVNSYINRINEYLKRDEY